MVAAQRKGAGRARIGHLDWRARAGGRAIAQLARDEFDLVLLDLWLPGIDGLSVLERVRGAAPPPVVVISGHGSVEAAVKAPVAESVQLAPPLSECCTLTTVAPAGAVKLKLAVVSVLPVLEKLLIGVGAA